MPLSEKEVDALIEYWKKYQRRFFPARSEEELEREAYRYLNDPSWRINMAYTIALMRQGMGHDRIHFPHRHPLPMMDGWGPSRPTFVTEPIRELNPAFIEREIHAYPWQHGPQGRARRREVEIRRVERVAHELDASHPGLEAAFARWHMGIPRVERPRPRQTSEQVVEEQRRLLEDAVARKRERDDEEEDQSASASSAESSSKKHPRGSGLKKRKR